MGLVDGIITDDSDSFLFGAKHVYRNVFQDSKVVEAYQMDDIIGELGLEREDLGRLLDLSCKVLLVGSVQNNVSLFIPIQLLSLTLWDLITQMGFVVLVRSKRFIQSICTESSLYCGPFS